MDFIEIEFVKKKLRGKISEETRNMIRLIDDVFKEEIKTKKKKKKRFDNKIYVDIFNKYYGNISCCQKCSGTTGGLQIHHIDKNHNNNEPLNLIKLCLSCHTEAHKGDRVYNLMLSRLKFILNN